MDEQQRERIQDDLRGIVKGDLLFDDLSRVLYSTDASLFEVKPLGIVLPRDTDDVQALVRYAHEHQLPLAARGAGSGLAGESLGAGLIVDFSRYFREIVEINDDTVRVQPGVVLAGLNNRLAAIGRRFAPDPASADHCTIGGMLATNASGAGLALHGYTSDHVVNLQVVLDSGDGIVAGPGHAAGQSEGHLADVVDATIELLKRNSSLIGQHRPRTPYDRCGYQLPGILTENRLNLVRLLIGSEGTLALITEATLRTIPLAADQCLTLLGFATLENAIEASRLCMQTSRPAVCQLMEHRFLALARSLDPAVAAFVPPGAQLAMLVEYESMNVGEAATSAMELLHRIQWSTRLAVYGIIATEPEELAVLRRLRESALPRLFGLRSAQQPLPFIEDVAVPTDQLLSYLRRAQEVMQQNEITASFLVDAGTGQVHARPFLDLAQPDTAPKMWKIANEIHELALAHGGTVSSQHGTGIGRTPWVAHQFGPAYKVLRGLKQIFDPHGIFNPGKIVVDNAFVQGYWPLRHSAGAAPSKVQENPGTGSDRVSSEMLPARQLRWQDSEFAAEVSHCNGCGHCRTELATQRMCPIFHALPAEAATPRAKANLLRHVLQQSDERRLLSSDEVRAVADLCVNCKMCAIECPAHVNVPKLMLETKAANIAEFGLDRFNWVLARTESFAALGSAFAFLVNAGLRSRTIRWMMERLFGVSRQRRLPAFAGRGFMSRAQRRGWTRRPRSDHARVAYFVDVFANYNDPQIAEAVVAVLHHQGIEVYVPPGQVGCGMAPLAQGDVETARESAQTNIRALGEIAREGYTIVCSEPTAALMLREDYLNLVDDPDARLIAQRTVEFTTYLWQLHRDGRLRTDLQPLDLTIGHHVPCHLKALRQSIAGPRLLSLIPDLQVYTIDVSCSGMAGTFGIKAENYELSHRAGKPMLDALNQPQIQYGSTECSTCRLQMVDGTRKRTLHPAQYLALSYGLLPEIGRTLRNPVRELVVT